MSDPHLSLILVDDYYCHVSQTHDEPHSTYNAHTGRMCKFRLAISCLPADNPQQSEEASHIGPGGNCKCRRCMVGGVAASRESNEGYDALHEVCHGWLYWIMNIVDRVSQPGPARSIPQTLQEIKKQLSKVAQGRLKPVTDMQTETGVKDRVTQVWISRLISKAKCLKKENPSWSELKVQQAVQAWLDERSSEPWSPLLSFPGKGAFC